jgi:hypothetical protein
MAQVDPKRPDGLFVTCHSRVIVRTLTAPPVDRTDSSSAGDPARPNSTTCAKLRPIGVVRRPPAIFQGWARR